MQVSCQFHAPVASSSWNGRQFPQDRTIAGPQIPSQLDEEINFAAGIWKPCCPTYGPCNVFFLTVEFAVVLLVFVLDFNHLLFRKNSWNVRKLKSLHFKGWIFLRLLVKGDASILLNLVDRAVPVLVTRIGNVSLYRMQWNRCLTHFNWREVKSVLRNVVICYRFKIFRTKETVCG
jgi:hypothetical protein